MKIQCDRYFYFFFANVEKENNIQGHTTNEWQSQDKILHQNHVKHLFNMPGFLPFRLQDDHYLVKRLSLAHAGQYNS